MAIATFPKFAGTGRTLNLLNEELLLLGSDDLGIRGRYISFKKPRNGLLALQYSVEDLPLAHLAHQHSSLVSRNSLTVVGGKFKSRGKLSKFTWTELSLKWENGSAFVPSFIEACNVKHGVDVHIIFGGERKINGKSLIVSQVVKINTTEEIAYELEPMIHRRVSHDCQLLNKSVVLVSGGFAQRQKGSDLLKILPDELYNINSSGKVIKVLDLAQSVRRFQHAMIKTEDRVWALGGKNSSNLAPSAIAEFDTTTNSWVDLNQQLHSTNTSELVVTQYPVSSLDCVPQCQCGTANDEDRIFGGNEAKVNCVSN